MSFISQSRNLVPVALAGLVIAACAMPVAAGPTIPKLFVSMSDTTVQAGDTSAWISVSFVNYTDTVSGFTMTVLLDRPDILEFRTDEMDTIWDTTYWECTQWYNGQCIDSEPIDPPIVTPIITSGAIDTVGSRISKWEYVTARSQTENQHDIKITGLADWGGPPYTPGIKPQSNPGLLCRLNLRVYQNLPDSDRTVTLYIVSSVGGTNFSDPHGNLIGTITNYNICDSLYLVCDNWIGDSCAAWLDTIPGYEDTLVIDTFFRYWICKQWGKDHLGNDSCLSWGNYSDPDSAVNADSISIDSLPWTVYDETAVFFTSGHLTVVDVECVCGDMNNDGLPNVGDAVFLINFIFKGGPAPAYPECSDVNNDGLTNVGDAVYMINFIFKGGLQPNCGF
jgi:hypothetical protein